MPGLRVGKYLSDRVLAGAEMIVPEPVPVHRAGVLTRGNFLHGNARLIPALRRITGAVKAAGAVIRQQLYQFRVHGHSDLSFALHWSVFRAALVCLGRAILS